MFMFTRYLDPKNDLAFKKIFGEEKHKRIPIAFLNAVLGLKDDELIIDLEFLNPIQAPDIQARKESTVDVLVRDQQGSKYIVEMQVAKIKGFEKRAQFYAAKTYCSHQNSGAPYEDLKKVIFLAITSYVVFPDKTNYKSDHVILDNETYENDLKDFSFTFVELPKFTKTLDELETLEDQWFYFLKHAPESNDISKVLANNPEIKEAYDIVERFHWTEEELLNYDRIWMSVADQDGMLKAASEDGHQKGLEKGRELGFREGQLDLLKKMLELGMQKDEVCKLAGLSPSELESLDL